MPSRPPGGTAGAAQRPVADDAGAQQRGGLLVGEPLGQAVGEPLVDEAGVGVAAVGVPAGELRGGAQVLVAPPAVPAGAVGAAQPGDADPLARRRTASRRGRRASTAPTTSWPGVTRGPAGRQVALRQVQVGAADPAAGHPHPHLPRPGLGQRPLDPAQRPGADRPRAARPPTPAPRCRLSARAPARWRARGSGAPVPCGPGGGRYSAGVPARRRAVLRPVDGDGRPAPRRRRRRTPPVTSRPTAIQVRPGTVAPTRASTSTPGGAVGAHDHDRPVAVLRAASRAPACPCRWLCATQMSVSPGRLVGRSAGEAVHHAGPHPAVLPAPAEVTDLVVADAAEVGGRVRECGRRPTNTASPASAGVTSSWAVPRKSSSTHSRPLGVELDAVAGERVPVGAELRPRAPQEAVAVPLGPVGPQQATAAQRAGRWRRTAAPRRRPRSTIRPAVQRAGGVPAGPDPAATTRRGRRDRGRRDGRRRRGRADRHRARVGAAHVEPERRVGVGHQPGVGGHPQRPAVHAEHEVVDRSAGSGR